MPSSGVGSEARAGEPSPPATFNHSSNIPFLHSLSPSLRTPTSSPVAVHGNPTTRTTTSNGYAPLSVSDDDEKYPSPSEAPVTGSPGAVINDSNGRHIPNSKKDVQQPTHSSEQPRGDMGQPSCPTDPRGGRRSGQDLRTNDSGRGQPSVVQLHASSPAAGKKSKHQNENKKDVPIFPRPRRRDAPGTGTRKKCNDRHEPPRGTDDSARKQKVPDAQTRGTIKDSFPITNTTSNESLGRQGKERTGSAPTAEGSVDELVTALALQSAKQVVTTKQAVKDNITITNITSSTYTIESLVQQKRQIKLKLYLAHSDVKYLQKYYPYYQFVAEARQFPHPHPILNIERAIGEDDLYRRALSFVRARKETCSIIDIGGNPSRHVQRPEIHSCNPILSASDVPRALLYSESTNSCSHTAEECKCVEPDVYMSIHSLYYLSPDTIVSLCKRSKLNCLFALLHEFDDTFGSFANGEATYQLSGPEHVVMNVRGNTHSYRHSNMSWMRQGSYSTPRGTLAWTKLNQYASQGSFLFTFSPLVFDQAVTTENELVPALQDSSYYGEVSLSNPLNDRSKVAVAGDILSLPDTRVFSWGPSVIVYQRDKDIVLHCPKGAVAEAASWSMGRERTPDNFKNLLAYMRHKMKIYNLPSSLLDSTVFAASSIGFVRNVAFETSVLHGVVKPLLPVINTHKDALNHKFKFVWTWRRAAAAVLAGASILGTTAYASSAVLGTAATLYGVKILATGGVAAATAAYLRSYLAQKEPVLPKSSLAFPRYVADRSSNPPRTTVQQLEKGTKLPATDPTSSVDELLSVPFDPSAKVDVVDPTENREKPGITDPLVPVGVVSSMCVPVVPSNSSHSSLAAIAQRIVKNGPYGRGEVDETLFQTFRDWVFDNLDELGLTRNSVAPISFDEWNSKYPLHQQVAHRKALDEITTGDYREWLVDQRGMFTKIESLTKSTADGVPKLAPRGIQSGTPHHNVATGPFCKAFSKRLATAWSVDGNQGPMYASGCSAEQLGSMYSNAVKELSGRLGILEGDFARFDSTIHPLFLELEADIYQYCGAPEVALTSFRSCISTYGRDKFGNKFSVDGGRHSGDHNTSCGNTLLQGLAILFCVCFYDNSLTKDKKLPRAKDIIAKYSITLPLLGDDNMLIADEGLIRSIPLRSLLAKLGLELEPKVHLGPDAAYHATFCSSRFYPVEGGTCVMGPGIGRGIAKSGWYVNPPASKDPETLLRADSISKMQDCSFIPFLSQLWRKNHELTKGKGVHTTREMQRTNQHNAHAGRTHMACLETYRMVESVYGLTLNDLDNYNALLAKVTTLPCVVDYAPLARAMEVDGVLTSDEEMVDVCLSDTPTMTTDDYSDTLARVASLVFLDGLLDVKLRVQELPPSASDQSINPMEIEDNGC